MCGIGVAHRVVSITVWLLPSLKPIVYLIAALGGFFVLQGITLRE